MSIYNKLKLTIDKILLRTVFIPKYIIYNRYKKSSGVSKTNNNLIVSLTTFPKRFNVVHLTIESILNQTVKPDQIVLWLIRDEIEEHGIPEHIKKLTSRGLDIEVIDENLKPYNKLIFALEKYPNSNIITVDDDIIYPGWFISKLLLKSYSFPGCIIAYRCLEVLTKNNKLEKYVLWTDSDIKEATSKLFFTGVGGVLYPPNSLYKDVLNRKLFTKLSPSADDIWFNVMAFLQNTKVIQATGKWTEFPSTPNSQDIALSKTNVALNENDIKLQNVYNYYRLFK